MPKKTEKIEIRVSPELKGQLKEHSSQKGEPLSQIIRFAIDKELSQPEAGAPRNYLMSSVASRSRFAAASFIVLVCIGAIGSFGANRPALAQASARVAFAEIDKNRDGKIDRAEFDHMMSGPIETFALDGAALAGVPTVGAVSDFSGGVAFDLPQVCEAEFASMPSGGSIANFGAHSLAGEGLAGQGLGGEGNGVFEMGMVADDLTAALDFEFKRIDGNGDGQIIFPEFQVFQRENNIRIFEVMDADGDGVVTPDEHNPPAAAINDGQMSDACHDALASFVPPSEMAAIGGELIVDIFDNDRVSQAIFASADANMDGQLTLDEFLGN